MSNQDKNKFASSTPAMWVDLKTIAEIKEITPRALRISLNKKGNEFTSLQTGKAGSSALLTPASLGKYVFRKTKTQGGKSYEILLSSLESKVQEIYKNTYYREIVEAVNQEVLLPIEKSVQTESGFIPEAAKTIALAKVDLIQDWIKFRNKHKPKQAGDKLFLDLYNSGEYLKNVFLIIGKTSRGSLLRWNKLYTEYESWEALVPQYNYTSFNEYKTSLTEEEIGIFLKLLLHPNQFSIGKAIKLTTYILEKKGIDNIPCGSGSDASEERLCRSGGSKLIPKPITFRRYAEYFRRNNYDKWILMREGEKALRDKVEPYLSRDISKIEVGDVLVADGHRLNFLVINPFTGYSLIVQLNSGKYAEALRCA